MTTPSDITRMQRLDADHFYLVLDGENGEERFVAARIKGHAVTECPDCGEIPLGSEATTKTCAACGVQRNRMGTWGEHRVCRHCIAALDVPLDSLYAEVANRVATAAQPNTVQRDQDAKWLAYRWVQLHRHPDEDMAPPDPPLRPDHAGR